MKFYRYILAFGSNLGNREFNCQRGEEHLLNFGRILSVSRKLYTEPLKSDIFVVEENQEAYLNYIIEFHCSLSPQDLYKEIAYIEDQVGHDRTRKWAPRHLDIDILFVSVQSSESQWSPLSLNEREGLIIPHSEILKRPFLVELLQSLNKTDNLEYALFNAHRTGVEL